MGKKSDNISKISGVCAINNATFVTSDMCRTLTSDGVDKDEVFKVSYLSPLPALGHVRRFEKLLWCSQRDSSNKDRKADYINCRYPCSL